MYLRIDKNHYFNGYLIIGMVPEITMQQKRTIKIVADTTCSSRALTAERWMVNDAGHSTDLKTDTRMPFGWTSVHNQHSKRRLAFASLLCFIYSFLRFVSGNASARSSRSISFAPRHIAAKTKT